jgi:hypothetical protein
MAQSEFTSRHQCRRAQSEERDPHTKFSEALSMANTVKNTIKSRKIGFILASGADGGSLNDLKTQLERRSKSRTYCPKSCRDKEQ